MNDINKHVHLGNSEGCLFEMIQYEYHSVGCKQEKLSRKDLEMHKKQKMEEHLMMTKNELTNTSAKLDDTKAQLDDAMK